MFHINQFQNLQENLQNNGHNDVNIYKNLDKVIDPGKKIPEKDPDKDLDKDLDKELNVDDLEKNQKKYISPKRNVTIVPATNEVNVNLTTNDVNVNQYKNMYCANCGEKGHVVKECTRPITSFGIIAFKVIHNKDEELYDKNKYLSDLVENVKNNNNDVYPKIKFLLIQRKDTMGYIDFIRGKYSSTDEFQKYTKIQTCLNEMTFLEKEYLMTLTFDQIWNNLWINKNSRCYLNEYENAKKKFQKLDIPHLVKNSETVYSFNEFSFPKGRRNMKETNIACAEREFYEETGYDKSTYDFIKNYPIIQEEFMGTNNIKYRHTYYLVKMKENTPPPKIDYNNQCQTGEVKNLGWFTIDESMSLMRPYDTEKKKVLVNVNKDILEMNFEFNCSSYYTNYRKWKYNEPIPSKNF